MSVRTYDGTHLILSDKTYNVKAADQTEAHTFLFTIENSLRAKCTILDVDNVPTLYSSLKWQTFVYDRLAPVS